MKFSWGPCDPASVTVSVPARLHLGFLDLNGGLGRRFGGLGLSISRLRTLIEIERSERTNVVGADHARAARYLDKMEQLTTTKGHRLRIIETVPAHAGLGSGTQLALAIAAGLRQLRGRPLDIASDALQLGRGERSGLGIGLFERGGLVVDGGRGPHAIAAPVISRLPFPADWRVILMLDRAQLGVHGDEELAAFADAPMFPDHLAAHLCRLTLIRALPALVERDLPNFGVAIKEIQAHVGDHFAPFQGGARFASARVAAALNALDAAGAHGIGQSSWGPTGFAFAADETDAERLVQDLRGQALANDLDILVCTGLNHGADIKTSVSHE